MYINNIFLYLLLILQAAVQMAMSFNELVRAHNNGEGEPGYVCDAKCLVRILKQDTEEVAKRKIADQINEMIRKIETEIGRGIKKFYIGKSHIDYKNEEDKRKKLQDHPDPAATWNTAGIGRRWTGHKTKEYGKDGLIVMAAIEDNQVYIPRGKHYVKKYTDISNQEDYTLKLEKQLIQLYQANDNDRCANKTDMPGGLSSTEPWHAGYVIYLALRWLDSHCNYKT